MRIAKSVNLLKITPHMYVNFAKGLYYIGRINKNVTKRKKNTNTK